MNQGAKFAHVMPGTTDPIDIIVDDTLQVLRCGITAVLGILPQNSGPAATHTQRDKFLDTLFLDFRRGNISIEQTRKGNLA